MSQVNIYLYTADTLSRAPIQCTEPCNLQEEADLLMEISIGNLPASSQYIDKLTRAQATDPVCSTLIFIVKMVGQTNTSLEKN